MSQNVEAEKRSHITTSRPMTIGTRVVATCALAWKSGSSMPIRSPGPSGSSSPACAALMISLPCESIAPFGEPVVPDV